MAKSTTIKSLGDIPSIGIYQGHVGQIVAPMPEEPNKYKVRFPFKSGYYYVELFESVDFVFIEGDYSQCLSNGSQKISTAPFSLHRSACFDVGSHADGVDN